MLFRFNKFTIAWALIILVLTIVPGTSNANIESSFTDKIVHFVLFAILSLLMIVGLSKQSVSVNLRHNAVKFGIITSVGYGIVIELIQILLPYRSFSAKDILFDALGALFGYGLFYVIYKMNLK